MLFASEDASGVMVNSGEASVVSTAVSLEVPFGLCLEIAFAVFKYVCSGLRASPAKSLTVPLLMYLAGLAGEP